MMDSEGSITDSAPFWGSKAFLAAEQACTVGSSVSFTSAYKFPYSEGSGHSV